MGRWEDHEQESGLLARRMAVEMARVHLTAGHDVVVPQYLGRVDFIVQLQARAEDASATTHHREASRMVGGARGLADMWDRLQDVVAQRPGAVVVWTKHGDVEGAYAAVLAATRRPARR